MQRLLILAPMLLIAACSHSEPGIEVRTVEVVREVQRPCPGTVPDRPAKLGQVPSDPVSALAIVAAKLVEYAGDGKYADQAEAYFEVCSKAE